MSLDVLLVIFQVFVLVFAFSVHEAAHAWAAWRLGDPTAYMLGRVTLNPAKHIDPFGSVIFPLVAMIYHLPLIGWAKPCPVTTRNFKHIRRDDILTTLAGPGSNLLMATVALIGLIILKHAIPDGANVVDTAVSIAFHDKGVSTLDLPQLFPVVLLLYFGVLINLGLFVFNLIPLPPLDGSRVLRHYLPYSWLNTYDSIGVYSIFILMIVGGRLLGIAYYPLLDAFNTVLFSV